MRADTCLVVLETPANPTLELVDVSAVTAAAGDVPVLVDNTFATPVLQKPPTTEPVLVLHSATKYLGGHGDAMGGVIACSEEWAEALRARPRGDRALLHPMGAPAPPRLATLPLRVRAQQEGPARSSPGCLPAARARSAVRRAWPSATPSVSSAPDARTRSHAGVPRRGRATTPRRRSPGRRALHARRLARRRRLPDPAPRPLAHRPVAAGAKPDADVLRLSIGLEDLEDLCADLARALGSLPGSVATASMRSRP